MRRSFHPQMIFKSLCKDEENNEKDFILDGEEVKDKEFTSGGINYSIEKSTLIGLYFDNGICAEHEMGIKDILNAFNVDTTAFGVDRRRIRTCNPQDPYVIERGEPSGLYFKEFKVSRKPRAALVYQQRFDIDVSDTKCMKSWLKANHVTSISEDEEISAAWDDSSFAVYVSGKENVDFLRTIYDGFKKHDIIMYVGNAHVFNNGGLTFILRSTMTEKEKEDMYKKDVSNYELQKASESLIKAVKKKFPGSVLAPRWKDENEKEIVYWLNPCDQQRFFMGWVTTQELKDWINNKGFIVNHGFSFEKTHNEEYKEIMAERRVLG